MNRSAIIPCTEEEYSLAPSWIWRHAKGWKPLLMYFRGPAGVPFFIAPFLSLMGIWRFARTPQPLTDPTLVIGAKITGISSHLGSYGMGGPGFAGLRIRTATGRRLWIVITVWGVAEWLTVDETPCHEGYPLPKEIQELEEQYGRPLPTLNSLKGATITGCALEARSFFLTFQQGPTLRTLKLCADSSFLPAFRGDGTVRIMPNSDDLRNAILLSRRANLWV